MRFLLNYSKLETKKEIDGNDYLVAYDVPIAKTGLQYYTLAELGVSNSNTEVAVYRDVDTFKDKQLVDSFDGIPLVMCHPDNGQVTDQNFKDFIVGSVSGPYEKNGCLYAKKLTIIDKLAIASVLDKTNNELSIGFKAEIENKKGSFGGKIYNFIEKVIHGNHLALCERGKAGPFFAINSVKKGKSMYDENNEEHEGYKMQENELEEGHEIFTEVEPEVDEKNIASAHEKLIALEKMVAELKKEMKLKTHLEDDESDPEERALQHVEKKEKIAEEHLKKKHAMSDESAEEMEKLDKDSSEGIKLLNEYRKRNRVLENKVNSLESENLCLKNMLDDHTDKIKKLAIQIKSKPMVNAMVGPDRARESRKSLNELINL